MTSQTQIKRLNESEMCKNPKRSLRPKNLKKTKIGLSNNIKFIWIKTLMLKSISNVLFCFLFCS